MEEWSESPVKRSYAHYEDEREDKDEKDDEDDKSDRDNRDERDDLEERVGSRHKRRRGSDSETPGHGASDIEYRILCPISKIGAVIGKGGSIIKSLRLDTKAKIKVEDVLHGSDERVIYISSAPGCDREARDKESRNRDGHRGHDRDEMLCPAQSALFRIHHCITEREDHTPTSDEDVDDDDEPPTQVTARLLVSDSQVGCLIGKGGRIIEQMRKDIAAQIRVLPKASLPPCAYPSDELVQLSGTPALVKKALYAVSSKLYDNPTRERSHRPSGLSHGPGGGMYSSLHAPVSMMGMGHHLQSGTGNSGSMRRSRTDGSPEEELTVSILCPKDKIGSMIGKGGAVVRKLREDSGAKIKVCDQVDDSDERVIQISAIEYMDRYASPVLEAVMQVNRRLAEISADREGRNPILSIRLLVRAHQIGCLLGKGGQIITEMRKSSRANIRIPPKDELPRCADEGSELVQVSGEAPMVEAALIQVLNRLRSNLFKGRDVGHVITGMNRHGGGYGGRDDPGSPGGYSHDYGNYSTSPGATRSSKDSRRRQR